MKKEHESLSKCCGYRIADLRKDRKMTQAELAAKLNISKSTLGHYEQGISVPPSQVLVDIADFFRVPADYLLNRSTCLLEYRHLSSDFCKNVSLVEVVNQLVILKQRDRQHILYLLKIMKRANEN